MAATHDLFLCLSRFVDNIHKVLSKSGKDAIESEIGEALKKGSGTNILTKMEISKKIFSKWDNILIELKNLSRQLEKGDVKDIISASKRLSIAVSSLQILIAEILVNVGSFVPGPVGIVCSIVLAIGCFAVGDIPGGFMNLIGVIPFARCAKYLPKFELINMIKKSGLEKYIPLDLFTNSPIIKVSKNFAQQFADVVSKSKNKIAKGTQKSEYKLLSITGTDKLNQLNKIPNDVAGMKFGDLLQSSRENPLIPTDGLIRGWGSVKHGDAILNPYYPKFGLL